MVNQFIILTQLLEYAESNRLINKLIDSRIKNFFFQAYLNCSACNQTSTTLEISKENYLAASATTFECTLCIHLNAHFPYYQIPFQ